VSTARRKTRRKRTARRTQAPLPGWAWMLFGLAVGLAVAAAIYVNDRSPVQPDPAALPVPVAPRQAAPAEDRKAESEDRFQFYEMLPNFEVVIPEQDLEARPDVAPAPLSAPGVYVLQAGSFSSFEDADRMKAQLALLGITSRIQKVSVDERTFHRVRIGPVEDLDEVNEMRARLRRAKVEVMVIRIGE
jgi:cell division protein FtsN